MTIYFLILFGLYFALLVVLRLGWSKAIIQKEVKPARTHFLISVIIPVRNERRNIEMLFNGLSNQRYPVSHFEIIVVDDHSTDDAIQVIEKYRTRLQNVTVSSLDETEKGKKAALTHGVRLANGEIVATTDADCSLPPNWLTEINSIFQNTSINMAAGLVTIAQEDKLFLQWQAMEFASVMGTGVASFGLKKPLMCNGANLSFRKKIFEEVKGYDGNAHIASGDDEFLMRKMLIGYPGSVRLLNSTETIVITQPQTSVIDFLFQRIRWASKWKGNPSISAKLLATFIFLLQVSWIFFILTFRHYDYKISLGVLTGKVITDLLFLLPVFRFMKIKFRLLPFLGLQFLYPFYVILIGLLAPWTSYRWKDRKIL